MFNQIATKLFTELTPEQASVIEGGNFLFIEGIQAIKAGADTLSKDDTYITVNGGEKIWGDVGMSTGDYARVNRGLEFDGSARIELFDADGFLNGDDNMGGFDVAGSTNGTARARVSGSGSTYDVYYRVFA